MATQWYWRKDTSDNGPVPFRELVALVRDEVVTEDDLVRPHYSRDWQEAASVVGLFHMAGRGDVLERWEDERRQAELSRLERLRIAEGGDASIAHKDVDEMLSVAESLQDSESPAWRSRLREVERQRALEEAERHAETIAEQIQDLKGQAIVAAIEKMDAKELARRSRWKLGTWTSGSTEVVRPGLTWGLTIAAANLVALGILSWSETESMRFPRVPSKANPLQAFPIWGECSPGVYAFLFIDTVLGASAVTYALSKLLVSLTDE